MKHNLKHEPRFPFSSERHLEAKGRILVRTYSTVPLDPSNDKAESYAELERYSTVTALPYPADRIASAKAIRGDRVQVSSASCLRAS